MPLQKSSPVLCGTSVPTVLIPLDGGGMSLALGDCGSGGGDH